MCTDTDNTTTTGTATNLVNDKHLALAKQMMEYIDSSPDPFHVVHTSIQLLEAAGFEELDDSTPYSGKIVPGGKYYYTRNYSSLVAFTVGEKYDASNNGSRAGGFKVIGAHTDSPNLKVKPRSKRSAAGTIQIGVECYGGGLWHTWFDRDLGISGRVLVRSGDDNDDSSSSSSNVIQQRLVKLDRAILRIANLCIHLQTADERQAFKVNKEDHLSPILATEAERALGGGGGDGTGGGEDKKTTDGWAEHQEPILLHLLASKLNVNVENILDFELNLFDVQKAALGGARSEFVHAARLDNLASCFIAVQALIEHCSLVKDDEDISMIALYDHEEVGSESAVGAASPIMAEAVRTISCALNHDNGNGGACAEDVYKGVIAKSFVLSCDQAHAIHPNYASKHEKAHAPQMNHGMVIKSNANQRYATSVLNKCLIREVCKKSNQIIQEFIVRQDCGCGTTIGPIISTSTGIRCVDVGMPSLSMHSIRESMGIVDLSHGLEIFKAFFQYFREVDNSLQKTVV